MPHEKAVKIQKPSKLNLEGFISVIPLGLEPAEIKLFLSVC